MAEAIDQGPGCFDRPSHHAGQVYLLLAEDNRSLRDASDIEQIIDQADQVLHLSVQHPPCLLPRLSVQARHLQQVEGISHRSQRVPQFVAQHGQELILVAVGITKFLIQMGLLHENTYPPSQVFRQGQIVGFVGVSRLGAEKFDGPHRTVTNGQWNTQVRPTTKLLDKPAGLVIRLSCQDLSFTYPRNQMRQTSLQYLYQSGRRSLPERRARKQAVHHRLLARISVGRSQSADLAILLGQGDDAPVREERDAQEGHLLEDASRFDQRGKGLAEVCEKVEGFVGPLLIVDVTAGAEPTADLSLLAPHRPTPCDVPAIRPVGPPQPAFGLEDLTSLERVVPLRLTGRQIIGVHHLLPVLAEEFVRRLSGILRPPPVKVLHAAIRIGHPHDLGQALRQGSILLLALFQGCFTLLLFGNVLDGQQQQRTVGDLVGGDGPDVDPEHSVAPVCEGVLQLNILDRASVAPHSFQKHPKGRKVPQSSAQIEEGLMNHRFQRYPAPLQKGIVGRLDMELTVEDHQGLLHRVQDAVDQVTGLPELLLAPLDGVDVNERDHRPVDLVLQRLVRPNPQGVPVPGLVLYLERRRAEGVDHSRNDLAQVGPVRVRTGCLGGAARRPWGSGGRVSRPGP